MMAGPEGGLLDGQAAPVDASVHGRLTDIGLALLFLDAARASRAVALLALTTGAIGLLNLVGYVYGVQALYGLASYTQMALHTSVVFIVLGVGVISARPDRGPMAALVSSTVGGAVLRRLLPAAIGVPLVLGWLVLSGDRAGLYAPIFGLAFLALASMVILTVIIWWHATVLHRADAARQRETAERTRAEEALGKSQRLIQDIVDHSPSLIYMLDVDGRFLLVNRTLESLLGMPREALVGSTREATLPAEIAAQHRANDLEVIRTGRLISFEEQNIEPDGEHFYASQKFPLVDSGGHIYAVGGISTDITGRKRAEEETRRRNRELSVLQTVSRATAQSLELQETLDNAIEATLHALEIEAGGVLLMEADGEKLTLRAQRGLSEEFIEAARWVTVGEGMAGLVATEKRQIIIDVADYPSGRLSPVIAREGYQTIAATPLLSASDVVGVLNLATRRARAFPPEERELLMAVGRILAAAVQNARLYAAVKQLNADLDQRATELEAANRELEAFSYSVSHDLRAPLRAIQGFSRVLVEDHAARLDAEGHRVLGVVTENARQMGELIDDLLGFARISRQQIEPTAIDMTRLAQAVVAECRQLESDRDVTVTIDPLPVARGDLPMIRQALVNLVSNAFKFTRPRPDARIEIGGEEGPTETTYLVRDNGVGFDPRYADQLFKVFQRLHASTEFEGTGIGLAIVARVAHRHGGRVWADGTEGRGATFAFALPREGGTDA